MVNVSYEHFYTNNEYVKNIFNVLNIDINKLLNKSLFIKTYFKNITNNENKIILNKQYLLEQLNIVSSHINI